MSLDRSLLSFLPSASRISLTCFLASVFARAVGAGEPCHYTWIQIPNPPGWKCNSQAINNHGHVAGYLYNAGDFYRGFIWTPETGTVMLPRPAGVPSMQVYDLNDHGQAVGELQEVPNLGKVPFIWDGEQVEVIFMPAGSRNGHAWSINNLGQVVGQYEAPGLAGLHAFLWEDGVFTDLAPIIGAGSSIAWSIDDRSRIAGRTYVGSNQRAFRLELNKLDLFPLPPQLVSSECGEISGGAFAVGWGAPAPPGDPDYLVSGVIWAPGQTYVIGTGVPGQHILFSGVNESGRAVGSRGFADLAERCCRRAR